MSQKSYRTLLWGVSALGVVCFIFANSLLSASASTGESYFFLELLRVIFPNITHHTVRKLAHFAEYALLGAHFAFLPYLWQGRARFAYLLTLSFGAVIAFLDEGIQRLVPDRGASLTDVLIDLLGYLFALVFVFLLLFCIRKGKKNV